MLNKLIYWIRVDDTELGVPKLSGTPPSQELARPMMLLNVLTEFCGSSKSLREKYSSDFDWAVQAILKHVCCELCPVANGRTCVFCAQKKHPIYM